MFKKIKELFRGKQISWEEADAIFDRWNEERHQKKNSQVERNCHGGLHHSVDEQIKFLDGTPTWKL